MEATIQRFRQDDIGSFGDFIFPFAKLKSVEKPWRDNQEKISCIPAGIYNFIPYNSPKHGWVWKAIYVPDRTNIEIHIANYPHDVEGCIGAGKGYNAKLNMVTESEKAIELLRDKIGRNGIVVTVLNPI